MRIFNLTITIDGNIDSDASFNIDACLSLQSNGVNVDYNSLNFEQKAKIKGAVLVAAERTVQGLESKETKN